MIYLRFETRKNIIYVFSLADFTPRNIQLFWSDVFEKLMNLKSINRDLMLRSIGETYNYACVNYSKIFNRFYTIIPKYYER